jgi:succinate dehydrogenase hydrophobic anchor subunit
MVTHAIFSISNVIHDVRMNEKTHFILKLLAIACMHFAEAADAFNTSMFHDP